MDISDGLAADLTKLCAAAQLGADLCLNAIPIAKTLSETLSAEQALALALSCGEDFELLVTAPFENQHILQKKAAPLLLTPIGRLNKNNGKIRYLDADKKETPPPQHKGYDHFA